MLPHQGFVASLVSGITLVVTLFIVTFTLRREKKHQEKNDDGH